MLTETVGGSAGIGLALLLRVGLAGTADTHDRGFQACASDNVCVAKPESCTFPGKNLVAPVTIADLADGVSSDGRGPYLKGKDGVTDSRAGQEGALGIYHRPDTTRNSPLDRALAQRGALKGDTVKNIRSFTVNLDHPVPGGGGVPLGIAVGNGLVTQRRMLGDTVQNLLDIPVGATDTAAFMSVSFFINGRWHILQLGPNASGHCMETTNLVHGTGTSSGTIFRASQTKWVIDVPAGGVGRLFDMEDLWDHAVDKGLYYIHVRYEIGQ